MIQGGRDSPDEVREPFQDRKRDREAIKPRSVGDPLVMGPLVVLGRAGQKECFLNNQWRHRTPVMDAGCRGAMNMPVAGVAPAMEMLCTIAQLWMKNNMEGRVCQGRVRSRKLSSRIPARILYN